MGMRFVNGGFENTNGKDHRVRLDLFLVSEPYTGDRDMSEPVDADLVVTREEGDMLWSKASITLEMRICESPGGRTVTRTVELRIEPPHLTDVRLLIEEMPASLGAMLFAWIASH